jgi:hypothetical protein
MSDVRGSFMALPSAGGERLAELKEFKLKRSLVHLGLNKMATRVCTVDNRDQSKIGNTSPSMSTQQHAVTPDDSDLAPIKVDVGVRIRLAGKLNDATRTSVTAEMMSDVIQKIPQKSQPLHSRKYVANHHFHPEVLQAMMDQGKSTIDCIPVQFITDFDLVGNGYTHADLFSGSLPKGQAGPVYVPTPSYKNALDDYKLVSTRWRLNKMIASCQLKRKGNTTLAPRGVDNILLPVEKRGRVDADVLPGMDPDNCWVEM